MLANLSGLMLMLMRKMQLRNPKAVQSMNPDRIHETKKFSAERDGSGDVTEKFVSQFSSSDQKRPITDSDEPRRTDK